MKYLIASEGSSLESIVSGHFGRAPFFLIYDDENKSLSAKANDGSLDPHLVIRDEAKSGTKKLICGGIGPHAYQVAERFQVDVCLAAGITVAEAVKSAAEGKLPVTKGPTAHHHHDHHDHHMHH